MVIGIIGESCVGKSTLAAQLKNSIGAEVFTGKDYLRLAKNEMIAKKLFEKKLSEAMTGDHVVYVISEKEHLSFLPEQAVRVPMTADLNLITERFARRMHGNLPEPVRLMLERKHGCFDGVAHSYRIHNNEELEQVCGQILEAVK